MPFPWLRWFGSADTGRAGRRRSRRAQRRSGGETDAPQEDPKLVTERRQRKISVGIVAAFLFLIVGVVAFGYYQEFYSPPRVWAGSVRGVEFSMGDLVQRIRVLQGVNRYQGGQVNLSTVPFEYLQNLIDAEILRQESQALGLSITDELIEQELRRQFLPTPDTDQETDPGQLEREFDDNYGRFLTATGLSDAEFRVIIEEELSVRALAGLLAQDIEERQQQVEIEWILLPFDSEVAPNDVVKRLEIEDFTRVAQELNAPDQFTGSGGYVGWVPKGAFPEIDDTIFGNEEEGVEAQVPGTVSEPIQTGDGFLIVNVLSAAEERNLEDRMALKLTLELVEKWQRNALELGTEQKYVRMKFNSKLYEWVTNQVFITAPRVDRPTQSSDQTLPGLGR